MVNPWGGAGRVGGAGCMWTSRVSKARDEH